MPTNSADSTHDITNGIDGSMSGTTVATVTDPVNVSTPPERIGGVVLAAGMGTRFEAVNKLLIEIGGEALVRHATKTMLASPIEEVVVVLGYDRQAVRETLSELDVEFVLNDDYAAGQSTSVRAGIEAARERDWDACVFALGDMPDVSPDSVERLVQTYAAGRGSIVAAAYDRERGNPVLFDAVHFDTLAGVEGDTGGRGLIIENDDMVLVETDDPGVVRDIDRHDDVNRSE